jgi:pimeloyl-ACP methyl ester carboxylesterase
MRKSDGLLIWLSLAQADKSHSLWPNGIAVVYARTVSFPIRLQASLLCLFATGALAVPAQSLHHRVKLEGRGSRTVILESGLGDTLDVWAAVQPHIAAGCARTFSYNRAGYLGSDSSDEPRDSATIVSELRAELSRQNIKPPYVLVGHSLGGLYMQYFARNFPDEVAGLVLVDSTHWEQSLAMGNQANTPYNSRTAITLFMPWIMRREINDSVAAGKQVHASPEALRTPTIVLSSTRGPLGESPSARALAARQQDEIAADFPGSDHVRVNDSGHYIQKDKPEVVVEAVRKLAGCKP